MGIFTFIKRKWFKNDKDLKPIRSSENPVLVRNRRTRMAEIYDQRQKKAVARFEYHYQSGSTTTTEDEERSSIELPSRKDSVWPQSSEETERNRRRDKIENCRHNVALLRSSDKLKSSQKNDVREEKLKLTRKFARDIQTTSQTFVTHQSQSEYPRFRHEERVVAFKSFRHDERTRI